MLPEQIGQEQPIFYFSILIVLEILICLFTLASKQPSDMVNNIIQIIMLIVAQCLKSVSWAAFFAIFAFINALFVFDPVGLWIIGHGQAKTKAQNCFCLISFILNLVTAYVGYIYVRSLQRQLEEDFVGNASISPSIPPNNAQRYLYSAGANQNPAPQPAQRFQQFSGQGYSLD